MELDDHETGRGKQVNVQKPDIDIDMELSDDADIEYLDSAPDDALPELSPPPDEKDTPDEEDMVERQLQAESITAPDGGSPPSIPAKAPEQVLVLVENESAESSANLPNAAAGESSEKVMAPLADGTKVPTQCFIQPSLEATSVFADYRSHRGILVSRWWIPNFIGSRSCRSSK
jgi:hypothetical protein